MRISMCCLVFLLSGICFASPSIWDKEYRGPAWFENYQRALETGKEEQSPVLVLFSGSDWCPPCIKLDKNVLSEDKFQQYVAGKFVLLNIDFPEKKTQTEALVQQNQRLKKRFKVRGLPYFVVIDPESEKVLKKFAGCGMMGFSCSTSRVLNKLEKLLNKK